MLAAISKPRCITRAAVFDKVFGKIGIGDDEFYHDAGIVQRGPALPGKGRAGAGSRPPRYVAVVLACEGRNFGNLLNTFVDIDRAL